MDCDQSRDQVCHGRKVFWSRWDVYFFEAAWGGHNMSCVLLFGKDVAWGGVSLQLLAARKK